MNKTITIYIKEIQHELSQTVEEVDQQTQLNLVMGFLNEHLTDSWVIQQVIHELADWQQASIKELAKCDGRESLCDC